MFSDQTLAEATERLDMLDRLDMRGLISEPELQDLLAEQAAVTRRLQRIELEKKLKGII